jgi:hypothetical protein
MPIQTITADSLGAAFDQTIKFLSTWTRAGHPYCWFRGVKDKSLDLRPGAYWRIDYNEIEPLITFAQEGVTFAKMEKMNCWDTYYLAQHNEIPTRLLDWTDSFSAALFFALDGWDGVTTPCVWIMQPNLLNQTFLGWDGIIGPEGIEEASLWLPQQIAKGQATKTDDEGFVYDNSWPLAIYPKKGNQRLSVQRGNFTVHGTRNEPLDVLLEKKGGKSGDVFARLELNLKDRDRAIRNLRLLGVRRSSIYPDIASFVSDIREEYKW